MERKEKFMIGYIIFGMVDLEKVVVFYDVLFGIIGVICFME